MKRLLMFYGIVALSGAVIETAFDLPGWVCIPWAIASVALRAALKEGR